MKRRHNYKTEKIPEEDPNSNSISETNIQTHPNPNSYSTKNTQSPIPETKKPDLIIYSKFIEEVISEINFARTQPSEYAAKLERIGSTISGRKVQVGKSIMKLKEGSKIFDEAIQYLLNIGAMEPLELCDGLSESANELLSILILGDGDETRNDRHTILNPKMKYCGIASGILPSTKKCTVLNLVQHYFKPGEEIPEKILVNYTYRPNAKEQFKKLNGKIGEVFFDKKNKYHQKYNIDSYTYINDENENGKITGKKPKKIKKITRKFKDKNTGREVITVKTIITYIDGEEVVDSYEL